MFDEIHNWTIRFYLNIYSFLTARRVQLLITPFDCYIWNYAFKPEGIILMWNLLALKKMLTFMIVVYIIVAVGFMSDNTFRHKSTYLAKVKIGLCQKDLTRDKTFWHSHYVSLFENAFFQKVLSCDDAFWHSRFQLYFKSHKVLSRISLHNLKHVPQLYKWSIHNNWVCNSD
jgi:hypothetical protein